MMPTTSNTTLPLNVGLSSYIDCPLIDLFINDIINHRNDFSFAMMVVHASQLPKNVAKIEKAGLDYYDHYAIIKNLREPETSMNDNNKEVRCSFFGPINVDSSKNAYEPERIKEGIYRIIAGQHRMYTEKQSPGFFILKNTGDYLKQSVAKWHDDNRRIGLPSEYHGTTDYINFHKGGINSDTSEGCLTAPPSAFLQFRGLFDESEQGLLLFIPNVILKNIPTPTYNKLISLFRRTR